MATKKSSGKTYKNVDVKRLQMGQGAPFAQPSDRKLPKMSSLSKVTKSSYQKGK